MAYFTRPEGDGAGFTNVIRISGTDSAAVVDHEGPGIHISLDSRSFRPGDVVSEHPMLIVDLNDSSGINTSTSGIGHRIEAWLNNSSQSRDLTSFYTSKRDDYREGAVQMPLTGLPNGKNTIRVRAWDSYNNSATADTYFDVATSDQLSIVDLFNYPNPFADETLFTFRQNQQNALDVEIKVYSKDAAGGKDMTQSPPIAVITTNRCAQSTADSPARRWGNWPSPDNSHSSD